MSRLIKLLNSQAEFITKSDGGSFYYLVGNKKIRVADHLTVIGAQFALNIYIPRNSYKQYVVGLNNAIIVYNNYTELKSFLINWILIIKTQHEINVPNSENKIQSLEKEIRSLKMKIKTQEELLLKKNSKITINNFDFDLFSIGQQKQIKIYMSGNPKFKISK